MTVLSDYEIAQDLRDHKMPVNKATIAAGKACVIGYMKRKDLDQEHAEIVEGTFTGLGD